MSMKFIQILFIILLMDYFDDINSQPIIVITGNWICPTLSPSTASPSTASPTTLSPTTASPTTSSPTTASPTTLSPTTASPSTLSPTTLSPTTLSPTTLSPTTLSPTTLSPTTLSPTTLSPTTLSPTTLSPTTLSPTTLSPTTLSPTTLSPTTLSPTTLSPTTYSPTTSSPTTAPPVLMCNMSDCYINTTSYFTTTTNITQITMVINTTTNDKGVTCEVYVNSNYITSFNYFNNGFISENNFTFTSTMMNNSFNMLCCSNTTYNITTIVITSVNITSLGSIEKNYYDYYRPIDENSDKKRNKIDYRDNNVDNNSNKNCTAILDFYISAVLSPKIHKILVTKEPTYCNVCGLRGDESKCYYINFNIGITSFPFKTSLLGNRVTFNCTSNNPRSDGSKVKLEFGKSLMMKIKGNTEDSFKCPKI